MRCLIILILCTSVFAGDASINTNDSLFRILLLKDIATTPLLPKEYRKFQRSSLPARVDNSQSKYFRPVFTQGGGSCTIASIIGYHYTYIYNAAHDLDGDLEENQYPTHFIWNFCNGIGLTSIGKAFDLLRKMGTVNVPTWGNGMGGDEQVWISGYDHYFEAMKRKGSIRYSFFLETYEDIEIAKGWLKDMNCEKSYGGLLSFSNYFIDFEEEVMNKGSQSGKKMVTKFGVKGGHHMTIIGYDDSICFDFNGDGLYTDNKDITGDGKITLADKEWGGFKVVNSWGTGKHDKGYFYFPYRLYALPTDSGGLKSEIKGYVSLITPITKDQKVLGAFELKVSCKNRRNSKIHRGIATGVNATKPIHTNEIYLGERASSLPMTGTDSTIVMGFDATELLSNGSYQYEDSLVLFFGVTSDSATGTIHDVLFHDYRTGVEKTFKAQSLPSVFDSTLEYVRIPVVVNNSTTQLQIVTDSCTGVEGEQKELSLDVTGGEGGYTYVFDTLLYDVGKPIDEKPSEFDSCYNSYKLSHTEPKDWSGIAIKLPFTVSYFGRVYDTISASGYGKLYYRDPLMKAATQAHYFYPKKREDLHNFPALNLSGPTIHIDDTSKNKLDPKIQGLYYKLNDSSIDLKFGGIYFNAPLGVGYEQFTTRIHSNGRIDTYIEGNFSITDSSLDKEVVMGISDGYGNAQQYPIYTCREFRDSVVGDGFSYSYIPSSMPEVCTLSPDGTLTLKSDTAGHWRVPVAVTDSRGVTVKKCIQFIVGETGVVKSDKDCNAPVLTVKGDCLLVSGLSTSVDIHLYNILGREIVYKRVLKPQAKGLIRLTESLSRGVYVVKMNTNGNSHVQKIHIK